MKPLINVIFRNVINKCVDLPGPAVASNAFYYTYNNLQATTAQGLVFSYNVCAKARLVQ